MDVVNSLPNLWHIARILIFCIYGQESPGWISLLKLSCDLIDINIILNTITLVTLYKNYYKKYGNFT